MPKLRQWRMSGRSNLVKMWGADDNPKGKTENI